MNCLAYFWVILFFDINTKSRSLKSLWLKKLRLLRVSTSTEAYEINKKRSLQTIQSGLVTIVKSLQQSVILHPLDKYTWMLTSPLYKAFKLFMVNNWAERIKGKSFSYAEYHRRWYWISLCSCKILFEKTPQFVILQYFRS